MADRRGNNGEHGPRPQNGRLTSHSTMPQRRSRFRPARRRPGRRRRRIGWLIAGLALGALCGVLILYQTRQPSEPLTALRLQQARRLWEQVGPKQYAMHIRIRGAQHGSHRVEVRDGIVARMTTNGAAVRENTARRWSVPGLFGFLETELANVSRGKELYGADDPQRILLRVHFHPQFGYPAYFHRHVPGSVKDVEWIVEEFERQ